MVLGSSICSSMSEYLHDCNRIIVKDGRNVFAREFVRCVTYEQTCFADRTITNNNAPEDLALASLHTRRFRISSFGPVELIECAH